MLVMLAAALVALPQAVNAACSSLGYYTDSSAAASTGAAACIICPVGSACPDPAATSPTACTAGTWSGGAQAACSACPDGHSCSTTTALPILCSPGTYSGSGGACLDCGAGFACPAPDRARLTCLAPAWYAAGSTGLECSACGAGSACSTASVAPATCGATEYSPFGAGVCQEAQPGSYAPASFMGSASCPAGLYADSAAATSCALCPAGSGCTASAASACLAGFGSAAGSSACEVCPAGYKCDSRATAAGTACPDGYFSAPGSGTCTVQCPAGYSCDLAALQAALGCTSCPASQWQSACSAGTWSASGMMSCLPCPRGAACAATTGAGAACAPTQYVDRSVAAAYTCASCSSGSECDGETQLACQTGHYRSATMPRCALCPAGSYCPTATQAL